MSRYMWRGQAYVDPFLGGSYKQIFEERYFEIPESGEFDELAWSKASEFYREFSERVFDTCRKAKSELWKCVSEMEI